MRILFFGMRCTFSPPVLAALIDAGHTISAIVVPGALEGEAWHWERKPGQRPGLPMAGSPTLDSLAIRHGIPLAHAGTLRHADVIGAARELEPELIVVACFPRLLPSSLIETASHGGINLHPSLLPAFRGPEPLFWTLRAGLRDSGVTAHRLTGRFDAGAIYAQAPVRVPFGERLEAIDQIFAGVAGRLAVEVVAAIEQGRAVLTPQQETGASSAPFPIAADFVMPPTWTAERAYAFARAVAPLNGPLAVARPDGALVPVSDAVDWSPDPPEDAGTASTCDRLWARFVTGYVCFVRPKT